MKRFWAFIAACLFLLLTACGGSTSTTEPVWQAELPNTGITVQVSGCTLEEKTASYWANPGAAGEPQSIMELYATDSAPLLEIAAPKAQVDIQFVQPVAGGMAAYDLALPVEQVDMVFLTQPEDNSTRVRFDTIYNFIVTVTSGDQIDQFLIICARNGYGSVEFAIPFIENHTNKHIPTGFCCRHLASDISCQNVLFVSLFFWPFTLFRYRSLTFPGSAYGRHPAFAELRS